MEGGREAADEQLPCLSWQQPGEAAAEMLYEIMEEGFASFFFSSLALTAVCLQADSYYRPNREIIMERTLMLDDVFQCNAQCLQTVV